MRVACGVGCGYFGFMSLRLWGWRLPTLALVVLGVVFLIWSFYD